MFLPKASYWVICERGTDARDNGWHFYRYLKEKHSEQKIFYIIDQKSVDYEKVKTDAVSYGSLKNYWVVARAEKLISTHVAKFVPYLGGKTKNFFPWIEDRFYFLQHGVISASLEFLYRKNVKMNLFVCGAKPERDFIRETFGHAKEVVQYTGLARYDALRNASVRNQILVMPTWRLYLRSKSEFLDSDYYRQWQGVLDDPILKKMLRENGYRLIFYPHHEVQKYLDCFSSDCDEIEIASFSEYDIQSLLKESRLLITDFSSVYFDFAYMCKPILYFHFDVDSFFSKHHARGYFSFADDGFGKVCECKDDLIFEIQKLFERNMKSEACYIERINRFFPLRDTNNCERIYEQINRS